MSLVNTRHGTGLLKTLAEAVLERSLAMPRARGAGHRRKRLAGLTL